jgi:hypothetical protein
MSARVTRWGVGHGGQHDITIRTDDGIDILIRGTSTADQHRIDAWAERVRVLVDGTHSAFGYETAQLVDGAIAVVLPVGESVTAWQAAQHLSLRITRMEELEGKLRGEIARLKDVVAKHEENAAWGPTPTTPVCVRQDSRGVWALGNRSQGWSSFGYHYADWDDLNRHWPNLAPCNVGADEHGPYIEMACRPRSQKP